MRANNRPFVGGWAMAGIILILAIILLGGAIATVGDRIGTRVGKARLSLFNLRPRTTAVLVTIITGSIISASTLGILLATSKDLRDAVLRIETIRRQKRQAETELERTKAQKLQMQNALAAISNELNQSRTELQAVNRNLKNAVTRQQQTQTKLNQLQARYLQAQQNIQLFSQQSRSLKAEIDRLAKEQQQLQADRNSLLSQRNQVQARLQTANQQQRQLTGAVRLAQTQKQRLEVSVTEVENRLQTASQQRTQLLQEQQRLQQEVAALDANRKRLEGDLQSWLVRLRSGTIAIRSGQVLAVGTFRQVKDKQTSLELISALLREARRNAITLAKPTQISAEQQFIQITKQDVERLAEQLQDGQPYVVRILSAANHLQGETSILVFPQVARNQEILPPGERLASITLNPGTMTDDELLGRLNELFSLSNRRAIQSGVLPDPVTGGVGEFNQLDLLKFVLDLKQNPGDLEVTAVVPQSVYTAGPLRLELIATRNQRVILRSNGPS
jgi:uncharacterized protein (DUF3084 family)